MKTFLTIILIHFLIHSNLYSQDYSIGTSIGIGSFNGNFPSQTIFAGKLYFETPSPISVFNNLQFHITLAQDIDKFLPDSYSYPHYSYFTSFGISGVFNQLLNESIFIKENIGLIYLNDRSFDDINEWNLGTVINFGAGTTITKKIDILVNMEFGLTFNNTNVNYLLFLAGLSYKI